MEKPKIWFDGEWYQVRWPETKRSEAVRKELVDALVEYVTRPHPPTPEEEAKRIVRENAPHVYSLPEVFEAAIVKAIKAAIDADREKR